VTLAIVIYYLLQTQSAASKVLIGVAVPGVGPSLFNAHQVRSHSSVTVIDTGKEGIDFCTYFTLRNEPAVLAWLINNRTDALLIAFDTVTKY
jgi:hypothetical protein